MEKKHKSSTQTWGIISFASTKEKVKNERYKISLRMDAISWNWTISPKAEAFPEPGCRTTAGSRPSDVWSLQRHWHLSACSCRVTSHHSPPPADRVCVTAARQTHPAGEIRHGTVRLNPVQCNPVSFTAQGSTIRIFFCLPSWVRI